MKKIAVWRIEDPSGSHLSTHGNIFFTMYGKKTLAIEAAKDFFRKTNRQPPRLTDRRYQEISRDIKVETLEGSSSCIVLRTTTWKVQRKEEKHEVKVIDGKEYSRTEITYHDCNEQTSTDTLYVIQDTLLVEGLDLVKEDNDDPSEGS